MILVCGGTKGGVGKTTVAVHLAVLRSAAGHDVLLVDADEQRTSTDFTLARNQALEAQGGAGYTAIALSGTAVRTEVLRLAPKHTDVIIDVGGRDTSAQRAALSIAHLYAIPFLPGSFDVWTLEKVASLVEEARAFNPDLLAVCFLNRADAKGTDNAEAAQIASEIPALTYLEAPLGNRKAFRSAAAAGLAVTELKPSDPKAIAELLHLYQCLFESDLRSKRNQSETKLEAV